MKKQYLFGLLLLAVVTVGATAMYEAPTPATVEATETQVSAVDLELETAEPAEAASCETDDSFLMACNCLDQCRFNFQCGPGGSCVPSGPCGCKVCVATE